MGDAMFADGLVFFQNVLGVVVGLVFELFGEVGVHNDALGHVALVRRHLALLVAVLLHCNEVVPVVVRRQVRVRLRVRPHTPVMQLRVILHLRHLHRQVVHLVVAVVHRSVPFLLRKHQTTSHWQSAHLFCIHTVVVV